MIPMTPEQQARQHIDELLTLAGWDVQDFKKVNLSEALGVAVREYPTDTGKADYLLFVNRIPVGHPEHSEDKSPAIIESTGLRCE